VEGGEWNCVMNETEGTVTIVQEGRFQLSDDDGVSHLFILSYAATAEPEQLQALQRQQARVRVRYTSAPNLIGRVANVIDLLPTEISDEVRG
jgi:hypothetical protein